MSENFIANNIENDETYPNSEDGDYEILINRLKEIKIKIALLEKAIFK